MKIIVSEEIESVCPTFVGACVEANVVNTPYCQELWDEIHALGEKYKETLTTESLKEMSGIAATRKVYRACGKDPDFKAYFDTYAKFLKLREGQKLHFELGRAVVGQMGSLITKVLYVKQGTAKQFAIVDAGMTDLIRPALYQAYHKIENITSEEPVETYDVVGPICESSDVFAKQIDLNKCHRGDLIAIRSAGAYGEIMASQYNCRQLPKSHMSEDL